MRPWIWLVAAACGSAPAPPPVVAERPSPPPIAPSTCADVGVILRGPVASDDPSAGGSREAVIEQACEDGRWPRAIVDCVAESRKPPSCLDRLSPRLVADYQARLADWAAKFGNTASSGASDGEPPPASSTISCDLVADAVARVSSDVTLERGWVLAARKRLVAAECAAQPWQESTKQCVVAPTAPTDALASCLVLEPMRDAFAKRLVEINNRAAKIGAAKQSPSAITCAKVVSAYYGDVKWRGALDKTTAAERRKRIAGSRAAMQHACTADTWSDTLRACLATDGGTGCFDGSSVAGALWGYPAVAAGGAALPEECTEYRRLIEQYAACPTISDATRDALAETLREIETQAEVDFDAVRTTCLSGTQAMAQSGPCP